MPNRANYTAGMTRKTFSWLLLGGILALAGCEDQRRHQVGGAVELAAVSPTLPANAAPIDVARAMLQALEEAQKSRVNGMGSAEARQAYSAANARIAAMTAKADVHKSLKQAGSFGVPKSIDEAGAVTMTIESWTSLLAHYNGGIQWDLLNYKRPPSESEANVYVEAENPAEAEQVKQIVAGEKDEKARRAAAISRGFNIPIRAAIDVRLIKVDGQWRVNRVEIGPARSAVAASPAKAG